MRLTIERTSSHRMTDMYVVRFPDITHKPPLNFTKKKWADFCDIKLQRGEKIEGEFKLEKQSP